MAAVAPWVLLGRVLRVGFDPGVVGAGEELWEEAGVAPAGGAAGQAALVAAVQAAGINQPDFSFPFAPPPQAAVVTAGFGAHPDNSNPDRFPYIIAAGPGCILVHFAGGLSRGTNFADFPNNSSLVLMRFFVVADDVLIAAAEIIPDRLGFPDLVNVGNVGLFSDNHDRFKIAELQVHRGRQHARLVCLPPNLDGALEWEITDLEYPLHHEDRDWAPHGAVTCHSTIWWFDLSWGLMSCDMDEEAIPDIIFHPVPDGRVLAAATPDIHTRRCITVSRQKVRFAEIVAAVGGAPPTLCMWTRKMGANGWTWRHKPAMSFEMLWDDDSYVQTGLPRIVPVLVAVCPSDPNMVYFALEQRIFGVNVRERMVFDDQPYALVNIPGAPPLPPSSRYVIAWDLPVQVAFDLGINPLADFHAGQVAVPRPEEGGIITDDEAEEPVAEVSGEVASDSLDSVIDYAEPQAPVAIPGFQIRQQEIQRTSVEQQAMEFDVEQEVYKKNVDVDRPGPSQDPRDDAGEGSV